MTDSRTSLLVTLYAIVVVFIVVRWKNKRICKIFNWVNIMASVSSIGISILIAANAYRVYDYIWYDDRKPITMLFYHLNSVLNGRIRILVETAGFEGAIQTWRIFSRPENDRFFDLGWVRLFYWYGIIPGGIFVAAIIIMLVYFYKRNDYMSIAFISSICIYTVIEAHIFSDYLARNYIFFLLGTMWYKLLKGSYQGSD